MTSFKFSINEWNELWIRGKIETHWSKTPLQLWQRKLLYVENLKKIQNSMLNNWKVFIKEFFKNVWQKVVSFQVVHYHSTIYSRDYQIHHLKPIQFIKDVFAKAVASLWWSKKKLINRGFSGCCLQIFFCKSVS